MADYYTDRVVEGSATTGTGTLTLDGVSPTPTSGPNYRTFAAAAVPDASVVVFLTSLSTEWEISRGTYTVTGTTLTRTLLSSSTGALINWGAGTKTVSLLVSASTLNNFQTAIDLNTAKVTNATHTGDVTGATALTIAANAVTNAKADDVPTATIKGRITAATGDPEDLTATQARTVLELGTAALKNTGTSGDALPILNVANTFSGAQKGAVTALTSTTNSIAINLATNNNFSHTTTENTTLAAPSNPVAGQEGIITITQDATTARTLAYNTFWKFPGGTVPALTDTVSAVDVFVYYVESATRATCQLIKDVK